MSAHRLDGPVRIDRRVGADGQGKHVDTERPVDAKDEEEAG